MRHSYFRQTVTFVAALMFAAVLMRYQMPQKPEGKRYKGTVATLVQKYLPSQRVFCYAVVPGDIKEEHAELLLSIQDAAGCDDARLFSSVEYPRQPRMHKVYEQSKWLVENWNNQMLQVGEAILTFYFSRRAATPGSAGFDWLVKIDADTWLSPCFRKVFEGLNATRSIVVSTGDGTMGGGTMTADGYFLSHSRAAMSSLRPLVHKAERCAGERFSGHNQGHHVVDHNPCLNLGFQHVFPMDERGYSLLLNGIADDSNPDDSLRYVSRIIESGSGWCDPMHFDPQQAARILGDPKVAALQPQEYRTKGPTIVEALIAKKASEHGWGGVEKEERERLVMGVMSAEEVQLCRSVFSSIVSKRGDRCFSNELAIAHSRSLKGYEAMRGFNAGVRETVQRIGAC